MIHHLRNSFRSCPHSSRRIARHGLQVGNYKGEGRQGPTSCASPHNREVEALPSSRDRQRKKRRQTGSSRERSAGTGGFTLVTSLSSFDGSLYRRDTFHVKKKISGRVPAVKSDTQESDISHAIVLLFNNNEKLLSGHASQGKCWGCFTADNLDPVIGRRAMRGNDTRVGPKLIANLRR